MALYTMKTEEEALAPLNGYQGGNSWVNNQIASFNTGNGGSAKDYFNSSWRGLYENAQKYGDNANSTGYKNLLGNTAWGDATNYLNKATTKLLGGVGDNDFNADSVLNAYSNMSNDDRWDVYQNLQNAKNKYTQAYSKAEKEGNKDLMDMYSAGIKYADMYDRLLGGVDRGDKSLGKSIGDWITSGGIAGDMSRTATNILGDVTGNSETAKFVNEKYNVANEGNNPLVQAANFGGGLVGNIGANVVTGGAYGLANSGAGLGHEIASAVNDADKNYYVDQDGNIVRQNQTNEQKLADIGGAALNLGLNVAGAKGVGPTLNFKNGETLQNLVANRNFGELAKGVGKYAAKELPWAVGTSLADTAIQATGYGDEAWKNFGENLGKNIAGDIAMDVTGAARQGVRQQAAGENPQTELYRRLVNETEQAVPQETTGAKDITSVFEPDQNLSIEKRNKLQSIGQQLKNTGKTQKYGALYDALDAKTAARAVQTGAPDALSKLGVNPENYREAAKTSNYVNKVVSDLAEQSGVKVNVTDLPQRLSADNLDVLMSDTATKKYNSIIKQIVPDGSTPDEYSAGYLLKKSRELGAKAANLRGNTDDVKSLRQALTDAKYTLRDIATSSLENAEITGDLTNDNIAKGLAQIGANQKIQDYYTEAVDGKAPTVADYIRRSSLFEQARDMGEQIESEKYTRSASKAPTNPMTKLWNASGLDQPANVILKNTVAPIAGFGTKLAGSAIEGAGNLVAKATDAASNLRTQDGRADLADAIKQNFYSGENNPQMQLYSAVDNSTQENANKNERTAQYLAEAQNDIDAENANSMYGSGANGSSALYNTIYGNNQMPSQAQTFSREDYFFEPTGDNWTDMLSRAMRRARNAEDYEAFGALFEMYKDGLSKNEKTTSTNNLSATQQAQLAKFDAADSAINELEGLFEKAGGGKGPIAGNLQSIAGDWGWDSNAKTYNDMAEGLVNQIAQAVGKTDSLNTEGEVKRALKLIPQLTDDAETAKNKLEELRRMLATTKSSYQSVYGVAS